MGVWGFSDPETLFSRKWGFGPLSRVGGIPTLFWDDEVGPLLTVADLSFPNPLSHLWTFVSERSQSTKTLENSLTRLKLLRRFLEAAPLCNSPLPLCEHFSIPSPQNLCKFSSYWGCSNDP